MPRVSRLLLISAMALPALAAGACARAAASTVPEPAESAEPAAQRAAEAWLHLVDRAMYGASWDSAAATFRQAVSRTEWYEAVREARGPNEPFGSRRLSSRQYTTSLPGAPAGEYVVLQYETDVARGGSVVETVVAERGRDGRWRVSGYFVRPR